MKNEHLQSSRPGIEVALTSTVMPQYKTMALSIAFFAAFLWQKPLLGDSSSAKPCESLYAELLAKARKSLQEKKHDETVQFLLDAAAVAEYCANAGEEPRPQRQEMEIHSA
jgi:hypothetical protein